MSDLARSGLTRGIETDERNGIELTTFDRRIPAAAVDGDRDALAVIAG